MPHEMQNVNARPEMVEGAKEHIIIALLERHYDSLTTLEQCVQNLEVKLESVTKVSGIRSNVAEEKPLPSADGRNEKSSKATRMIGEMGQRIIALSGRLSALTEYLET